MWIYNKIWFISEFSASHDVKWSSEIIIIYCWRKMSDYYQCWKQLSCTIFLWKPWYTFSTFYYSFLKIKWMLLFIKDAFDLIKSDRKDMWQNIYISNKCCSFELSIHLWILKNKMHHSFHKNITVFNIDNNQKCFLNSKSAYYNDIWRSRDTEDCWKYSFDHINKSYFNRYSHRKQLLLLTIIFYYFYCIKSKESWISFNQ